MNPFVAALERAEKLIAELKAENRQLRSKIEDLHLRIEQLREKAEAKV